MTGARLVILDEPTSVLAPQEVEALFGVVAAAARPGPRRGARDAQAGRGPHDRRPGDRAARRPGRSSNAEDPGNFSDAELVEAMVGRRVPPLAGGARRGAAARACRAGAAGRHGARRPRARRAQGRGPRGAPGRAGRCRGRGGQRPEGAVRGGAGPAAGHARARSGSATRRRGHRPARRSTAGAVAVPEDPVVDSVVPGLTVLEHMVLDGRAVPRRGLGHRLAGGRGADRGAGRARAACTWRPPSGPCRPCRAATSSASCSPASWARTPRSSSRPTRAGGWTSRTPGARRSCCSSTVRRGAGVLMVSEDLDELHRRGRPDRRHARRAPGRRRRHRRRRPDVDRTTDARRCGMSQDVEKPLRPPLAATAAPPATGGPGRFVEPRLHAAAVGRRAARGLVVFGAFVLANGADPFDGLRRHLDARRSRSRAQFQQIVAAGRTHRARRAGRRRPGPRRPGERRR